MSGKEDRIRARAYELWERNGRAHGNHEQHWQEAARQIEAEPADDAAPLVAAPNNKAAALAKPKRAAKLKAVEPETGPLVAPTRPTKGRSKKTT